MAPLEAKLKRARDMSWERFGKRITFYLPGMFSYEGRSGKYPAISITGDQCALQCDHCRAKIIKCMPHVNNPQELIHKGLGFWKGGSRGLLLTGGCDERGCLPWDRFLQAIEELKKRTGLYISIHCGLVDYPTSCRLKEAGVDQALIDVIGDDDTYREVYHIEAGVSRVTSSLEALHKAALPTIPHIVCGLYNGKMRSEKRAVEIIAGLHVEQLVIVSLMRIAGTPMQQGPLPGAEEIAELIAEARFKMPAAKMNLGCARQRGNVQTELLAIEAGINRMAIPSEEAIQHARRCGLEIRYQSTCCSVSLDLAGDSWE